MNSAAAVTEKRQLQAIVKLAAWPYLCAMKLVPFRFIHCSILDKKRKVYLMMKAFIFNIELLVFCSAVKAN